MGITYYYKYEICLDDIFNCLGGDFCNIFPSLLILFFTPLCEKDFGFQEKDLG